jgi:hypothetical protein
MTLFDWIALAALVIAIRALVVARKAKEWGGWNPW